MKFEVGDRVRVIPVADPDESGGAGKFFNVGDEGSVLEVGPESIFVQFDNPLEEYHIFGITDWYCSPDELEKL